MQPLAGIKVVDFSTLLPGPLASLILAEAGAEVIKIERPGGGDELRGYEPAFGGASAGFALLNRGKRSIALDLKANGAKERLMPLLRSADALIEQFRPGVMERIGLGYPALVSINPRLIYCSITGYGQSGPKAQVAAHDLNYLAETGLLHLAAGPDGAPVVPPALIADIAGGSYPAVLNILLALRERDATGRGCHLDIAMTDHLFPLMWWALGQGFAGGRWPRPGGELLTGGSPRFQIYPTADGRFLATAPLEQRFWQRFAELIGLEPALRDDRRDPAATKARVAAIIQSHDAAHWRARFAGEDVCCAVVASLEEAVRDPHFVGRGLFAGALTDGAGRFIPALPVPLAPVFREARAASYPALGEGEDLLDE
ncbi:MAG TPA: CaiB/BaiF CoA-transferase family protein [Geminicoccaceae bacterium]|nr:CaiB/BaiF CoA-transferase family protein [Geminicoccaceae bacterium]